MATEPDLARGHTNGAAQRQGGHSGNVREYFWGHSICLINYRDNDMHVQTLHVLSSPAPQLPVSVSFFEVCMQLSTGGAVDGGNVASVGLRRLLLH